MNAVTTPPEDPAKERLRDAARVAGAPVRALFVAQRIGAAELLAAAKFYRSFAFGMEGARDGDGAGSSGASSPDSLMVSRMDAAADYSLARKTLPREQIAVLEAMVLHGVTPRALAGGKDGGPRIRMVARCIAALEELAALYSSTDGSRSGHYDA